MGWEEVRKARNRLSREEGTVIKDWGGKISFALLYPNSYYIGMSNLGLHALYRLLNQYDDVVCERAFWEKEDSQPLSVESQRPLADFSVLAFTVSYELDYFNIIQTLKKGGIPLYSADRDERNPLVIAGGPCIIANPLPLSPFFDCLCIGEAEAILPAMLPVVAEGIEGTRAELLQRLASLPGMYVPQHHPRIPVDRQYTDNLDGFAVSSAVLTRDTELGNLYLIEVERGCNWGCRFCLTSTAFRPMRFHSLDTMVARAQEGLAHRKRLGMVGAAVPDHPQIDELMTALRGMRAELSISSLRMRPLSHLLLNEMAQGGARTLALAPEAGSQRLRRVIKKGISEKDILGAMEKVAQTGIKQLKLYFMIGLPSETDEDIEAITELSIQCKKILDRYHAGTRLTLNIAPFVPKAGTPFQWLPMAPLATLKRRLSLLKNKLHPKGIKVKSESPALSEVQVVLSRGDATVAEALAEMEEASLSEWRRAAARCHLDIEYYAHQQWNPGKALPWDIIDSGIKREQLRKELEKALSQM